METLKIGTFLILASSVTVSGENYELKGKFSGVIVTPYIKKAERPLTVPSGSDYKIEDVRTMLELVSTKFSKVLIYNVDVQNVPYQKNKTYYQNTFVRGRTAEIAARINKERNMTALTVLIGIYDTDRNNSEKTQREVNVAVEAAQIANQIYPGTVEGFLLTNQYNMTLDWAKQNLFWIDRIRRMTHSLNLHLRVGTRQYCKMFSVDNPGRESEELWRLRKDMIAKSDLIACASVPTPKWAYKGVDLFLNSVRSEIIRQQSDFKRLNEHLEFMWETGWTQTNKSIEEEFDALGRYWKLVDELALQNNFSVWFLGAFNYSQQTSPIYLSWWELRRNNLINNASGYLESVYAIGKRVELSTTVKSTDANGRGDIGTTERSHFESLGNINVTDANGREINFNASSDTPNLIPGTRHADATHNNDLYDMMQESSASAMVLPESDKNQKLSPSTGKASTSLHHYIVVTIIVLVVLGGLMGFAFNKWKRRSLHRVTY